MYQLSRWGVPTITLGVPASRTLSNSYYFSRLQIIPPFGEDCWYKIFPRQFKLCAPLVVAVVTMDGHRRLLRRETVRTGELLRTRKPITAGDWWVGGGNQSRRRGFLSGPFLYLFLRCFLKRLVYSSYMCGMQLLYFFLVFLFSSKFFYV